MKQSANNAEKLTLEIFVHNALHWALYHMRFQHTFELYVYILPLARFWKMAGSIVLGSDAVSADVLLYISVAIKASFLKFDMCNICKNNIAKMFLVFSNFKIVDLK